TTHNLHPFPTRRSSDLIPKPDVRILPREAAALQDSSKGVSRVREHPWRPLQEDAIANRRNLREKNHVKRAFDRGWNGPGRQYHRSEEHTSELQSRGHLV